MTAPRPLRPLGHIAADLAILAAVITSNMRKQAAAARCVCWVDDDGCVYLAPTEHPRADSMQRHAAEQRINTYRMPSNGRFPLRPADVQTDLQDARAAHASRALAQSMDCAA